MLIRVSKFTILNTDHIYIVCIDISVITSFIHLEFRVSEQIVEIRVRVIRRQNSE